MNPIKSPHDLLMEQAGFAPQSPGLVNSGQQMLLNQTGILPQFADGGSTRTSAEDMLAELFVNGELPQHLKDGGKAEQTLLERLKKLFKHVPMPATASLAVNAGLNGPGAMEAHHNLQENLQGDKYGAAAQNAYELGSAFSPYFLVPSIYDAGRYFSESAAGQLAHDPAQRKQMQEVSSTPLGGALAGDAGLAAQIMGQHEYDEPPSILANTRLPK
jgi:hypothetical protein